jgi:peptidoglycan/xylan/chitin deacetylase (PgdA/CDA1 family)
MNAKRALCRLTPRREQRSLICVYHSVQPRCPASIPTAEFRLHMEALRKRCKTVPLEELLRRSDHGESGMAAVTFDDGFRNCYEEVFPVLQELSIPFTVFVTSGFIEAGSWDFSDEYRDVQALTWPQIVEMQRHGAVIGCHTHLHCRWSSQSTGALREDLRVSREVIEDRIGRAVTAFAYPYGQPHDYDKRAGDLLAEAGFSIAVTTLHTTFRRCRDKLRAPRLSINTGDTLSDFHQQITGRRDILALIQSARSWGVQVSKRPLAPH